MEPKIHVNGGKVSMDEDFQEVIGSFEKACHWFVYPLHRKYEGAVGDEN